LKIDSQISTTFCSENAEITILKNDFEDLIVKQTLLFSIKTVFALFSPEELLKL